jgi:NAD-dependent DNA ligase
MTDFIPKKNQQEIHEINFQNAEELLLYHKYLYYELSKPMVTDQHFDQLDQYARRLSQYVCPKRFPPEEYVHETMVGFDKNHRLWPKVKERFGIK